MKKASYLSLTICALVLLSQSCDNPLQEIINAAVQPKYPGIVVKQGAAIIGNGSGQYDFGSVVADGSGPEQSGAVVFTIQNSGTLELSLSPEIVLSDYTDFERTNPPELTVPPGEDTFFTLNFNPGTTGAKEATVSIASNSADSPYTFTVTGTGINSGTVATPVFSESTGNYYNDFSLTISCTTPGANIYYTTDGSTPDESDFLYSGAIGISATTAVKARAFKLGMDPSGTRGETFTLVVSTPTIDVDAGTKYNDFNIAMACATTGAEIRYTQDGSTPDQGDTLYITGSNIPIDHTQTVRAKGFKTGYTSSATVTRAYTMQVATPTLNPPGGTFSSTTNITVSTITSGATLRYTTDGSTPSTTQGTVISSGSSFPLPACTTVRVIGYKTNYANSGIAANAFSIYRSVDTVGEVGQDCDITAAGADLYISYRDGTNNCLKVAKSSDRGTTWTTTSFDIGASTADGLLTSIDASSSTNVWVACKSFEGDLWVRHYVNSWGDPAAAYLHAMDIRSTGLDVDSNDVWIAWFEGIGYDLYLTSNVTNGVWKTVAVATTGTVGYGCEVAASGTAYISYGQDVTSTNLAKAYWNPIDNQWTITTSVIDSLGGGGQTSIAKDNTTLYVTSTGESSIGNALRFSKSTNSGSTWSSMTVDSTSIGENDVAFAGSTVVIAYVDKSTTPHRLKIARSTNGGSAWSLYFSDSANIVYSPTVATDGTYFYVCYYDYQNYDLKFVTSLDGVTW